MPLWAQNFLAWGTDENKYDSKTKVGHNKFREYKFIEIPKDVYDTFLGANKTAARTYTIKESNKHDQKTCSGKHTHSTKKDAKGNNVEKITYPMPAAIFENNDYWSTTCFYYDTGVKTTNSISGTIAAGKSIFWKATKDRLCTDSTDDKAAESTNLLDTEKLALPKDNTNVVIPKLLDLEITEIK